MNRDEGDKGDICKKRLLCMKIMRERSGIFGLMRFVLVFIPFIPFISVNCFLFRTGFEI